MPDRHEAWRGLAVTSCSKFIYQTVPGKCPLFLLPPMQRLLSRLRAGLVWLFPELHLRARRSPHADPDLVQEATGEDPASTSSPFLGPVALDTSSSTAESSPEGLLHVGTNSSNVGAANEQDSEATSVSLDSGRTRSPSVDSRNEQIIAAPPAYSPYDPSAAGRNYHSEYLTSMQFFGPVRQVMNGGTIETLNLGDENAVHHHHHYISDPRRRGTHPDQMP
ncbi:hypothetical protein FB45DRAFT_927262 [Roridomyces roridus]|uniref:Uncharacterized protein n=1 Tax=Roridomyces roridus TaxID=1738132 RepID=A0AAD7BIQ6_9AGAR|nr:hypothetical protein FB45DRAFT_927262 [Roridomyces roridus]